MNEDMTLLQQPRPRRHYDLTPTSTNSSPPSSPSLQPSDYSSRNEPESFETKANRTRSILNLTSSTLFGIYTHSASGVDATGDEPFTPSGLGNRTPASASLEPQKSPNLELHRRSEPQSREPHRPLVRLSTSRMNPVLIGERVILLFLFGVAYGVIISHLHKSQQVLPVQIDLRGIRHDSWGYLMGWGGVGVLLGGLLPWVDIAWEETLGNSKEVFAPSQRAYSQGRPVSPIPGDEMEDRQSGQRNGLGADWNPVVRGIGAFIGIAFAIVCSQSQWYGWSYC